MKLARVSNAGLWVEAEGRHFLLDGLHGRPPAPYCGMDPGWEAALFQDRYPVDVVAFTHGHPDHFCPQVAARYLAAHPQSAVYAGPDVLEALRAQGIVNPCYGWDGPGPGGLMAIPTRHIGAQYRTAPHSSLYLPGREPLLFTGDASPASSNFFPGGAALQTHILAATFAFFIGPPFKRVVEQRIQPSRAYVLHLPLPQADTQGLAQQIQKNLAGCSLPAIILQLGQQVELA